MPRSNNKKEARRSKPEEKTTKIKTQKGKIPKNKKRKQHPKLKLFLKILLLRLLSLSFIISYLLSIKYMIIL